MQGEDAFQPVADGSRIWLPELVERLASSMQSNDLPCSLRLVNKATAALLRGRPQYTTVRLSQPVPHRAFAWRWGAPGATRSLTRSQRQQLVRLAAASGSVPNLKVAAAAVGGPLAVQHSDVLAAAARAGKVDVCGWVMQQGHSVNATAAAKAAAEGGYLDVIEFLLSNGASWDWAYVFAAACGGHLALVDWLLLRCPEGPDGSDGSLQDRQDRQVDQSQYSLSLLCAFAKGCSLAALQGMHRRISVWEPLGPAAWYGMALRDAAGSPTVDWQAKVEWLEAAIGPMARDVPATCVRVVDLPDAVHRLEWLRQRGYKMSLHLGRAAAEAGNVAVLEYLMAVGVDLVKDDDKQFGITRVAADSGRLEVLKLLHARGCLGDVALVVGRTAARGHLPVLVWAAAELGFDVRAAPDLMTAAGRSGSVEVLAWLAERGCEWSEDTFTAAAGSGCEATLEWLAERGCPMVADGAPYTAALHDGGDPLTLRCLRRLGCPWGPVGAVFTRCLQQPDNPQCSPHLSTLRCLLEAGCPVDWEAAARVAQRRGALFSAEVVSWMLDRLLTVCGFSRDGMSEG